MLKVAAMLSSVVLTAASGTVWWRTEGGSVIGSRNGPNMTCTLTMEDPSARMTFAWEQGLPLRATVEGTAWRVEPEAIARIAVRVGADWLANGDGSANITALTSRAGFMFVIEEPLEERLLSAREVTVQTPAGKVSVGLPASRMRSLLAALDKCRHVTS